MRPLLLLLLSLFCSPISAAQETANDRSRSLFDNGSTLYEEGRYAAAISAWEEGYELSSRPLFLFKIANAFERQGDLESTVEYLDAYRAYAPQGERDTLIRRIAALEGRMETASEPSRAVPWAPVVAFSTAGVGLAIGGGFGAWAIAAREQAGRVCMDGLCLKAARAAVGRDKRHSTIAAIALGLVGGVAAALGMVSFIGSNSRVDVRLGPGTVAFVRAF